MSSPPERELHAFDQMTEPQLQAFFQALAEGVKMALPPDTGFIVLAAPMGEQGVAQYVSNVRREDSKRWMLETIERWAARDHIDRTPRG